MGKFLVLAATFLMTSSAFAGVNFLFAGFDSDYVAGVGKLAIRPVEDGKLWVQWDQNACSRDGHSCTRMEFPGVTVTPTVVQDQRGTDGDLIIGLTENIKLEVGSGFNITRTVDYTAVLTKADGTSVRVPLSSRLQTSVK